MTEKAKIVEQVKQSFAHLQKAVLSLSDADDRETTNLALLLLIARHLGEHLGQAIAYARINGLTPPWTEEAQRCTRLCSIIRSKLCGPVPVSGPATCS